MEFSKVFLVSTGNARGALHLDPRNWEQLDPYAISRGRFPTGVVLEFDRFSGSRPVDFVDTTFPPISLMSDRLRYILQDQAFTGWTTTPARVFAKDGSEIPGYHVFGVTGRCGRIDDSRSTQVWRPAKGAPGKRRRSWLGLYFDPKSWDGSDIFGPDRTGWVFVTGKVKQALERATITNVHFRPLTEVERIML